MSDMKIGWIGQGWIGKNYADVFEKRGQTVIRYAQEEPYAQNRELIKECDIVFIAVPTPTTASGFSATIVDEVLSLVGVGKTAVIKSTILPGTTEGLQASHPDVFVMHSPEFLTEATAAHDAEHPDRNIVGIPVDNEDFRRRAEAVISVLPPAPYSRICSAKEAELTKYGGNCWFYTKVIFINMLYDLAASLGCDYEAVKEMMKADSRVGSTHLDPIHKTGRGAGGHCFIKDYAAFRELYEKMLDDQLGSAVLRANEAKNISLLKDSGKDLDLLSGVYK